MIRNFGFPKPSPITFKAHRTTAITSPTTSAWTDLDGFTVVDEETLSTVFSLNSDGKTIECHQEGLYLIAGCLHTLNPTTSNLSLKLLTRVMINGTDEMRCSQVEFEQNFKESGEVSIDFDGTAYLYPGDTLNYQYFVNTADIEFISDSNFDSTVAASFWVLRY